MKFADWLAPPCLSRRPIKRTPAINVVLRRVGHAIAPYRSVIRCPTRAIKMAQDQMLIEVRFRYHFANSKILCTGWVLRHMLSSQNSHDDAEGIIRGRDNGLNSAVRARRSIRGDWGNACSAENALCLASLDGRLCKVTTVAQNRTLDGYCSATLLSYPYQTFGERKDDSAGISRERR